MNIKIAVEAKIRVEEKEERIFNQEYTTIPIALFARELDMKLEIVSSSVPIVKIPLILLETSGTKTRKMAIKRTIQQIFQKKKINCSIPA